MNKNIHKKQTGCHEQAFLFDWCKKIKKITTTNNSTPPQTSCRTFQHDKKNKTPFHTDGSLFMPLLLFWQNVETISIPNRLRVVDLMLPSQWVRGDGWAPERGGVQDESQEVAQWTPTTEQTSRVVGSEGRGLFFGCCWSQDLCKLEVCEL